MKETNDKKDLQKIVDESVINAVAAASGNLKGDSYDSFEAALEIAKKDNVSFFNPTLSQYKEGLVINTNRDVAKIKRVPVGTRGNKAWCITCPAGYQKGDEIIYDQAFNFYPSTLRKTIQVTDEVGDPMLDETKTPIVVDGSGNQVWEGARACNGPDELLEYAIDKVLKVTDIKRDFGPVGFVEKNGVNRATGHKITSLPLFDLIG
jgi:hypothetical protein